MTTRLEMMNSLLAVNGETPVSSESSTNPAAVQASNTISRVDKKIQLKGWWCNTEVMTLLFAVSTGHVVLPANTLAVFPVDVSAPYVKRGSKLYDTKNNTFNIAADVKVRIVTQLDVSDLPESLAAYIENVAVRDHFIDDDGDVAKARSLDLRSQDAFIYLQRENLAQSNVNILQGQIGSQLNYEANTSGRGYSSDLGY